MTSKWHQKKAKLAEAEFERQLLNQPELETLINDPLRAAAMGAGEEELFEKKLSKEEKKARAKAAREAKKKGGKSGNDSGDDQAPPAAVEKFVVADIGMDDGNTTSNNTVDDGIDHEQTERLAAEGTICTFSASRKGVDDRSRDINIQNFTLQHMGAVLLDETEVVLNHGNRYGLVGRNGCGKSTLLKALGARAVPIPRGIDIFFLSEEVEPSDTMTAIDAVMSVDAERLKLEQRAEYLNQLMAHLAENPDEAGDGEKTAEEQQDEIMESLSQIYERLDALDASTAEVRARSILRGLGFTHEMQGKLTKDFSGGWRMRVSLARALFIQPIW
jgi:ATP-binding cassette subfamily F protein 2